MAAVPIGSGCTLQAVKTNIETANDQLTINSLQDAVDHAQDDGFDNGYWVDPATSLEEFQNYDHPTINTLTWVLESQTQYWHVVNFTNFSASQDITVRYTLQSRSHSDISLSFADLGLGSITTVGGYVDDVETSTSSYAQSIYGEKSSAWALNDTYTIRIEVISTSRDKKPSPVYQDIVKTIVDLTAPSVPVSYTPTASGDDYIFDWDASTDAYGIDRYNVQRKVGTGAFAALGNSILPPTTQITDTGPFTIGETYTYRVLAVDNHENASAYSTERSFVHADTEAPTAPTGLRASSKCQTTFTLEWNASTDNVGVTGYKVFKNGSLYQDTGSTATSLGITGQTAGSNATWTVKAYDAASNESAASSGFSHTMNATVNAQEITQTGQSTAVAACGASDWDTWYKTGHIINFNNGDVIYTDACANNRVDGGGNYYSDSTYSFTISSTGVIGSVALCA